MKFEACTIFFLKILWEKSELCQRPIKYPKSSYRYWFENIQASENQEYFGIPDACVSFGEFLNFFC